MRSLLCFFFGGAFLMFPLFVFSYDNKTTHPALTQEIVKFFNRSYPELTITEEDQQKIIQGSIDEDADARWLYHFYDPVYNRGLVLKDSSFPSDPSLAFIAGGVQSSWENAKLWAEDTSLQQGSIDKISMGIFTDYFSGTRDYSWDRGIYEYTWGSRDRSLLTLGHILHLLEDMTVPDHTRNDPHPPILNFESPYEDWTEKFKPENYSSNIGDQTPILFKNLNGYFDSVANYSNNNFFSRDTIFVQQYKYPVIADYRDEILSNGISYKFAYSKEGYRLFREDNNPLWYEVITTANKSHFYLTDNDDLILSDYWSHLSKQAVLHGAGVVKLFFDEVEKEKQTKILYEKNRSWFGKKIDSLKNALAGISHIFSGSESSPNTSHDADPSLLAALSETLPDTSPHTAVSQSNTPPEIPLTAEHTIPTTQTIATPPTTDTTEIKPTPAENLSEISTPSAVSLFASSNTSPNLPFAGIGGNPPPPSEPSASFSSPTPPESSSAQISPTASPPEIATSSPAHATSSPIATSTTEIPSPSDPPDIFFAIQECSVSIAATAGTCVLATTTLTLQWSTTAKDLDHYEISCTQDAAPCLDFLFSPTDATSTTYSLPQKNARYVFNAKTITIDGRESALQEHEVTIAPRAVVINEIAWEGTSARRSQDEWIELYNPTLEEIKLDGMILTSLTDNKPTIALSGTITPHGYYIIERTDDTVLSDISANITASFGSGAGAGLVNSWEALAITFNNAVIDKTPPFNACQGWCGGTGYRTMERVDPMLPGENPDNWGTWYDILRNGKNADKEPIQGTPGKRNTMNYLISKYISVLHGKKTLTRKGSPYIIPTGVALIIDQDAMLTIEPGAVIKFFADASLIVSGTLDAHGTVENPIIFTSLHDDECGITNGCGDTDGTSTPPLPGDWNSIKIASENVSLDNIIVRYGGGNRDRGVSANLLITHGGSISLTNSIVEHAKENGIWFDSGVRGEVAHTIIRYNSSAGANSDTAGIKISHSAPAITNNQIYGNAIGIQVDSGGTPTISDNTLHHNIGAAMRVLWSAPLLENNTADQNGINGVDFQGVSDSPTYTFTGNLPYVIQQTLWVQPNTTLTFPPGTMMKFGKQGLASVQGIFIAEGTAAHPIVFTSLHDDECGIMNGCGDTDGTSTPALPGDWQHIGVIAPGSITLDHAIVRFGGSSIPSLPPEALRIINTSATIKNSVIEKNRSMGIYMERSPASTIVNSIIRDHQEGNEPISGLYLSASSTPVIRDTIFEHNKTHIFKDSTSSYIDGGENIFR